MLVIRDLLLSVLDGEALEKRVRVIRGKVSRRLRIVEKFKEAGKGLGPTRCEGWRSKYHRSFDGWIG